MNPKVGVFLNQNINRMLSTRNCMPMRKHHLKRSDAPASTDSLAKPPATPLMQKQHETTPNQRDKKKSLMLKGCSKGSERTCLHTTADGMNRVCGGVAHGLETNNSQKPANRNTTEHLNTLESVSPDAKSKCPENHHPAIVKNVPY